MRTWKYKHTIFSRGSLTQGALPLSYSPIENRRESGWQDLNLRRPPYQGMVFVSFTH